VVNTINKAGFEVYLVGGCVRDLLLGLEPKDFDVATNAKPPLITCETFLNMFEINTRFRLPT
jgi:poly(A) polymerase